MGTKFSNSFRCITSKRLGLCAVAVLAMGVLAVPSFAQQLCLQDEYNLVQKQKLNCTANDVSIAQVTNIRDPQTGKTLSTCFQGTSFSFIADFTIKTTSSQARENVGLYIATNSTTQALTGACVDNIISPQHQCPGAATGILCGSNNYHETDPAPDNCGDTSSGDGGGTGVEIVTLQIDNFSCTAPAGSSTLVLPNCTSWQIPGGTIQCVSPSPSFPYPTNGPGGTPTAIPGSPAKCNCEVISLPITPVTVAPIVQKACNTAITSTTPSFTQNPNTQSPTSCDAGAEGSTVTYTVAITNTSNISGNNVVVDQICDDQYGNIFTANGFTGAACPAGSVGTATNVSCPPSPIAPGATGTCTFTAIQGEIKTVTDIVSASGHSSANTSSVFAKTQSNSVTVTSTDAPSTATVTKGFVGTEAGCATVRYSVDVKNTSSADEVLTLSSLTDSAYGDITKLGSGTPPTILGTTCGVANGLGTLTGTAGAGALPTTIAVGGDYKCQFDGQFCSSVDSGTCISQVDSVSGTIVGDEKEAVTQTFNTLTVKECFQATVTSQ
jgi:hypothetical protein